MCFILTKSINKSRFYYRALAFCEKNLGGIVPAITITQEDAKILAKINQELKEYEENLEKVKLRDAIRNILNISRVGNQYMQAKKPWTLVKGTDEEKIEGATVIGVCVNIAYLLSIVLYPYMPNVSCTIRRQLNVDTFKVATELESYDSDNIKPGDYSHPVFFNKFYNFIKEGHKLGKIEPLFKRITDAEVKVWKEKFGGVQEPAAAAPGDKKKEKKEKKPKQEKKVDAAAAATAPSDVKVEVAPTPADATPKAAN